MSHAKFLKPKLPFNFTQKTLKSSFIFPQTQTGLARAKTEYGNFIEINCFAVVLVVCGNVIVIWKLPK